MEMKFYQCAHCGQIIAIVKKTGVPIICCGEPMKEIIPSSTDASVEKLSTWRLPLGPVDLWLVKVSALWPKAALNGLWPMWRHS